MKKLSLVCLALLAAVSAVGAEPESCPTSAPAEEKPLFTFTRNDTLFPSPAGMPKPGPYYTTLVKMDAVKGFPFDYALYFSTDHHKVGGIWLYLCKGVPTDPRNWKSYDKAVADGDFNYLATKPEKNPIYSDTVQGYSSETPHANVIDGKVYMTYHNVLQDKRGQGTILATSPDGINFSRINGAQDSVILTGPVNHTGYFRWAPNPFSGVKHKYVGYSLYGGGANFRCAMWTSDDAIKWNREQVFVPKEGHAMSEADRLLIWHEIDPNSITPLGNGEYTALCAGGNRASGSMARVVELYEIFLASDGKTLTRPSRKVMAKGEIGSRDSEEVAEPTTVVIGDTWHLIYVGASKQGKENTVMSALGKLDKTLPVGPMLSESDRQGHFDQKKK
jgi:hypothetical protein